MSGTQRLSAATYKEVRAIAPAWLACLASLGLAMWLGGRGFPFVYLLGAIALGALSMGHEFNGGTLTLLLSQPRRREHLFLLKLGVLALMLLTLSAVVRIAVFKSSGTVVLLPQFGVDAAHWQGLVLGLPLLSGLFIAPCLTRLCRNPLAGMVFTVETPIVVLLVGELSVSMFGNDPAAALNASAFKIGLLWRGMLGISAIAAVSSWRLFMRLEATDDRGPDVRLPWLRSRPATMTTTPVFAKRHPVWLLTKKELRLQQLSFVVGGLYILGWFSVWSVRWRTPGITDALLFAMTAINVVAVSVLAGSLASAEERQLGTVEWHTLLPMSARTQWAIKAGTAVGVAVALGLGVPALLSSLTQSAAVRADGQPLVWAGAGLAVILLTVVSLYVSSLCTSGVRALMWSLPAGVGVLALVSRWVGFHLSLDPFFSFTYARGWRDLDTLLIVLLMVLNALSLTVYAGEIGLLLRFARANHQSAERGAWRIWNQVFRLGAFLALVTSLWFGVSQIYRADLMERYRVRMQTLYGTLTGVAVDSGNKPVSNYTVVVFRDVRDQWARHTFLVTVDQARAPADQGRFELHLRPGQYLVIAVDKLERGSERDPIVQARLKARAIPLTVAAGDSKTLNLTISTY